MTPPHPLDRYLRTLWARLPIPRRGRLHHILRAMYDYGLARAYPAGVEWTINGTDRMRLDPRFRAIPADHEPQIWGPLMAAVRAGDTAADAGANIGLYTVALAARVGPSGRVVAFEPDPRTVQILRRHIVLNHLSQRIEVIPSALGDRAGPVPFQAGQGPRSCVMPEGARGARRIPCVTLDEVFAGRRVDLLKVDVEGYEQHVLQGGLRLLQDPARAPRVITLELHPEAWPAIGSSGAGSSSKPTSFLNSFSMSGFKNCKPEAIL